VRAIGAFDWMVGVGLEAIVMECRIENEEDVWKSLRHRRMDWWRKTLLLPLYSNILGLVGHFMMLDGLSSMYFDTHSIQTSTLSD